MAIENGKIINSNKIKQNQNLYGKKKFSCFQVLVQETVFFFFLKI
jgi:hypothetical protein